MVVRNTQSHSWYKILSTVREGSVRVSTSTNATAQMANDVSTGEYFFVSTGAKQHCYFCDALMPMGTKTLFFGSSIFSPSFFLSTFSFHFVCYCTHVHAVLNPNHSS